MSDEYVIRIARSEDVPGIAAAHVASWRTTYAGIMPGQFLAELSTERRAEMWRFSIDEMEKGARKAIWVACERASGKVIGFLAGGDRRDEDLAAYDAELYALYLLKEHQRRGLGTRLMREFATWLDSQKLGSFFLWVLEGNPCDGFYPTLGGQLAGVAKPIAFGGQGFVERAYGWKDLSAFKGS